MEVNWEHYKPWEHENNYKNTLDATSSAIMQGFFTRLYTTHTQQFTHHNICKYKDYYSENVNSCVYHTTTSPDVENTMHMQLQNHSNTCQQIIRHSVPAVTPLHARCKACMTVTLQLHIQHLNINTCSLTMSGHQTKDKIIH